MKLESVKTRADMKRWIEEHIKAGSLPVLMPKRLLSLFSELRQNGELPEGVTYGYNTAVPDNDPNRNAYWLLLRSDGEGS